MLLQNDERSVVIEQQSCPETFPNFAQFEVSIFAEAAIEEEYKALFDNPVELCLFPTALVSSADFEIGLERNKYEMTATIVSDISISNVNKTEVEEELETIVCGEAFDIGSNMMI